MESFEIVDDNDSNEAKSLIENTANAEICDDVWSHFDKFDDKERLAMCRICSNIYSYKTTVHNLKSHLRNKHKLCKMPENKLQIEYLKNKKRSKVWRYFVPKTDTTASCLLCQNVLAHGSSSTNLKVHLRKKHIDAFVQFLSSRDDDTSLIEYLEEDDTSRSSPAKLDELDLDNCWEYFEEEAGRARCLTCRRAVDTNLMASHLETHLNATDDLLKTEEKARAVQPEPEFVLVEPRAKIRKTRDRAGTDDNALDDGMQAFLQYIGTLLRDIPKESSAKLQLAIIDVIVTHKQEIEEKRKLTKDTLADLSKQKLSLELDVKDDESKTEGPTIDIKVSNNGSDPYPVAVIRMKKKQPQVTEHCVEV